MSDQIDALIEDLADFIDGELEPDEREDFVRDLGKINPLEQEGGDPRWSGGTGRVASFLQSRIKEIDGE